MTRRRTLLILSTGLLAVALGAVLVAGTRESGAERPPDRVLVLSAKGYAFHAEGDSAAADNPPLMLHAGERVRIVIRNQEEADGVNHNFKIPGLSVRCSRPIPPGEEEFVEFTVPEDGEYTYTCCSHPGMGGRVEIDRKESGR